jgi:signal transduction histidine kinase
VSLRARFLALFAVLAVVPLVAVGVFDYLHSMRALESLVAEQVEPIVDRSVDELRERLAVTESNLLLLARNAETQRLFEAQRSGDAAAISAARAGLQPFMRQVWTALRSSLAWAELRDASDTVLYRLPEDLDAGRQPAVEGGEERLADDAGLLEERRPFDPSLMRVARPVEADGRVVGSLHAAVVVEAVLPREALEARFGEAGRSVVVDRARGQVLYHPLHMYRNQPLSVLAGPDGWDVDPVLLEQGRGRFVHREADTTRVTVFASLEEPAWTILASGATSEFAAPFVRMRLINLALALVVAALVAVAFTLFSRRETRSLTALTMAAGQVGEGNFEPDLPLDARGEAGTLTTAFGLMVEQVKSMLRQVESSRHMAAIGEFAAHVSHEIRNPLTSLKLNLQGLERDVESGHVPADCARPIEICLREIQRLDEVAAGVLRLGRPGPVALGPCRVHDLLADALEVVQAQLAEHNIDVERDLAAPNDRVSGDPESLKAAFLNLFLNAAEAMSGGGTLWVSTGSAADPSRLEVRIADDGPGIPLEERDRVLEPFVSTKSGGTGLGLPLAVRAFEEHGGKLALSTESRAGRGAEFVIDLPLTTPDAES